MNPVSLQPLQWDFPACREGWAMKWHALIKVKSIWNTFCNLTHKNMHILQIRPWGRCRMEGSRKQRKGVCMACSSHNQKCYWRQKMRPFPRKIALYWISNTSNEKEWALPQSHRSRQLGPMTGEESLHLFLDRRWPFGPGYSGTGVAEGDTCAAQYKDCGSFTQLRGRSWCGRACLAGTSVQPAVASAGGSGERGWTASSKTPTTDAWTEDPQKLRKTVNFNFRHQDMDTVKVSSSCRKKKSLRKVT